MKCFKPQLLGTAATALILIPGVANSFDIQSYLDQQVAKAKEQGIELKFNGPIDSLGSDGVQISNISILGKEMREPATIQKIRIEGIEDLGNGSFAARNFLMEQFALTGVSEKGEQFELTLESASGENIYYANPADANAKFYHYPNSTYQFGAMSVSVDGKTILSGAGGSGTASVDEANQTMSSGGSFNKFKVDLTAIDDPKFAAQRAELGYDELTLNLSVAGSWDMNSGRVDITDYTLDAEEAGKLNLTGSIMGLTADVARQFREFSAKSQAQQGDPDPKKQQLQAMQMMSMMGQLSFQNLSIRYDDNSLADRVLGIQAKAMGTNKQELVQLLPSMIPVMTARLGSPELGAALSGAAATFLANPGNFTISANPVRPLPFMELMATGSSQPAALVEALNITAKANQ